MRNDPFPDFPAGGPCEQSWHGQGCPLFEYKVRPAFSLPTSASPTLQLCALEDGFGEAVEMCDIPEPCNFPSLDSYVQSVNREANRLFTDQFSFKYSN